MVYFVGAGTGAVDLITVRGMRFLEKADVIIYAGSLVNPELLEYAKKECEIYNSAKLSKNIYTKSSTTNVTGWVSPTTPTISVLWKRPASMSSTR